VLWRMNHVHTDGRVICNLHVLRLPGCICPRVRRKFGAIDNAELKEGDRVLERLSRGQIVVIEEVKVKQVLVSHVEHGGIAITQLKKPQESLDYFDAQLKTNPSDAGAYAARGNVLQTSRSSTKR
jgi:hypothetical protein